MDESKRIVRQALFEAVQNQLDQNNPPETRRTLNRLTRQGIDREQAMRLICCALIIELNDMMRDGTPYNEERYISRLRQLPSLDWLEA